MKEINIIEKVIALESVDLFQGLSAEQLARIAGISEEVRFPPEAAIVDAKAPVDAVYVILDGSASLRRDGKAFHTAARGEVIGGWGLFDESPLAIDVVSAEDVRALKLDRGEFFELLADHSHIMATILRTLIRRFRQLAGA